MTMHTPFPMTSELLWSHPTYKRAQTILTGWLEGQLQSGRPPEKSWRQTLLDNLDMVNGKRHPTKSDWYWSTSRDITAMRLLYELVACSFHEEAVERMDAWLSLQETVRIWDEKFANDTDVA